MDYFNNAFTTFLGLECVSYIAVKVRKLSDFIKKYLNLCSEYERRSYRFVTSFVWVNYPFNIVPNNSAYSKLINVMRICHMFPNNILYILT